MCRWLAYSNARPARGADLRALALADRPEPPLEARRETTNGDGFGIGWYGERGARAVQERRTGLERAQPPRASQDTSARELVFAHIRASTGTPVQQTNCHPFRHGRWLWMHNGSIAQFHDVKRELMLAVDPSLYADVEGSTDSEAFFFLRSRSVSRTIRRAPWRRRSD